MDTIWSIRIFLKQLLNWNNNKIEGDIGYYGLQDWWLNSFSPEERQLIEGVYQPMGTGENSRSLTKGKIEYSSQTKTMFLITLSGWFNNPRNRILANIIIEKAKEVGLENPNDVLGNHFVYSEMIPIYYPQREKVGMLDKVIAACKDQIVLASKVVKAFLKEYPNQPLPAHRGYQQLSIILDKQGKYQEAIDLCEQAKQEGWSGDWGKRIQRYRKNIS